MNNHNKCIFSLYNMTLIVETRMKMLNVVTSLVCYPNNIQKRLSCHFQTHSIQAFLYQSPSIQQKQKPKNMHFTKFFIVSQLQNNTQIIAEHLNKEISSPKEKTFETQSPRARKRITNASLSASNSTQAINTNSNENNQFKLSASATFKNQKLQNQQLPRNRIIPLDLEQEKQGFSQFSKRYLRKNSQNKIIYQNEQAERQDDLQLKLNIQPKKEAEVKQFKSNLKDRKASCNLQNANFFKNPTRNQNDQYSQFDSPTSKSILIKKKSKAWFENNNFQFEGSNATSDGRSQGQIIQNMLPQTRKLKMMRKQSQNVDTLKKQVPSFITNFKNHRKSVDEVQLYHKRKITIKDFLMLKQLGKGSFGRVVLAVERQSKMLCAIKIMAKRAIVENNMIEQLLREIKIQMFISHPNIVKIHGFFDDLLNFYIITECALDGHLSQYIKKTNNPIPEAEAALMMYQICSAVSLLHSESIIHRDLKLQNVLLHDGVVKICDFGWSVKRDNKLRTTFCGTPVYLSPQILLGDQYDQSVDIWTIGIILYEMIYKTNPFKISARSDLANILNSRIDFKQQTYISKTVKDFIQLCLTKRALQRPKIRELMAHEFIMTAQNAEQPKLKN